MKSAHVTDAELNVLQALWSRGSSTIRQLTEELYPAGTPAQYATVKKLLERLQNKGFIHRDRSQTVHSFAAAIARDDLIGRRLNDMAHDLCRGSVAPLLSHLIRAQPLSQQQRDELRRLMDDLEGSSPSKNRP